MISGFSSIPLMFVKKKSIKINYHMKTKMLVPAKNIDRKYFA